LPFLPTRDVQADAVPHQYSWPSTLALALVPGALTTAVTLALRPLVIRWGYPPDLALTVSPVILLVELGYLLLLGRRRNGRLSLSGVVGYQRRLPLPLLASVVAGLIAVAAAINFAMQPIGDVLEQHAFGPVLAVLGATDANGLRRLSGVAVVTYFALNFVLNGIVDPVVEELYFRGHLLPRMPIAGPTAVAANALLFSAQHFWQPHLVPLIFVLQAILISVMVLFRDLRISIVSHAVANVVTTALSAIAYASAG
jgi:hypothetical protein